MLDFEYLKRRMRVPFKTDILTAYHNIFEERTKKDTINFRHCMFFMYFTCVPKKLSKLWLCFRIKNVLHEWYNPVYHL